MKLIFKGYIMKENNIPLKQPFNPEQEKSEYQEYLDNKDANEYAKEKGRKIVYKNIVNEKSSKNKC